MKLRLAILFFPMVSFAGVMNGGGGKGVLCTTAGTPVMQTLDIYEATNVFHLKEEPAKGDLLAEFTFSLERFGYVQAEPEELGKPIRLPPDIRDFMQKEFFEKVIFIPAGTRLPITSDATVPVLPPNCKEMQIAVFSNLGIEVDQEYWQMLNPRNQAALITHELLYQIRKKYGAADSDETRKFIGRLFSTTPPAQRFGDAANKRYLDCMASGIDGPVFDFAIYPSEENGNKGTVVSIRQLENVTTLGRVSGFFPDPNLLDKLINAETTISLGLTNEFRDENRAIRVEMHGLDNVTVSVRDKYTGSTGVPSKGSCRIK